MYKVSDGRGKLRGRFNLGHLKILLGQFRPKLVQQHASQEGGDTKLVAEVSESR
jgi:hypothetical protein